jgi:hypothetical protein
MITPENKQEPLKFGGAQRRSRTFEEILPACHGKAPTSECGIGKPESNRSAFRPLRRIKQTTDARSGFPMLAQLFQGRFRVEKAKRFRDPVIHAGPEEHLQPSQCIIVTSSNLASN